MHLKTTKIQKTILHMFSLYMFLSFPDLKPFDPSRVLALIALQPSTTMPPPLLSKTIVRRSFVNLTSYSLVFVLSLLAIGFDSTPIFGFFATVEQG